MMSAKQCSARASKALKRARLATDPAVKAAYEANALEWQNLAIMAAIQDRLQIALAALPNSH
jgi:hypothetical protein